MKTKTNETNWKKRHRTIKKNGKSRIKTAHNVKSILKQNKFRQSENNEFKTRKSAKARLEKQWDESVRIFKKNWRVSARRECKSARRR